MPLEELPGIGLLVESGTNDPVFSVLMLLGPLLIGTIALIGRNLVTVVLATLYIGFFVGYIAYKWIYDETQ